MLSNRGHENWPDLDKHGSTFGPNWSNFATGSRKSLQTCLREFCPSTLRVFSQLLSHGPSGWGQFGMHFSSICSRRPPRATFFRFLHALFRRLGFRVLLLVLGDADEDAFQRCIRVSLASSASPIHETVKHFSRFIAPGAAPAHRSKTRGTFCCWLTCIRRRGHTIPIRGSFVRRSSIYIYVQHGAL